MYKSFSIYDSTITKTVPNEVQVLFINNNQANEFSQETDTVWEAFTWFWNFDG